VSPKGAGLLLHCFVNSFCPVVTVLTPRTPQLRQYLYFCTSIASKLSIKARGGHSFNSGVSLLCVFAV
jgi:hypothetical protein